MCAALPFLPLLVVVLKCHVKLKAGETLNDPQWLTLCVYCIRWRLKHQQRRASYQQIRSNRSGTPVSPFSPRCLSLSEPDNSFAYPKLEFLYSLFRCILAPERAARHRGVCRHLSLICFNPGRSPVRAHSSFGPHFIFVLLKGPGQSGRTRTWTTAAEEGSASALNVCRLCS